MNIDNSPLISVVIPVNNVDSFLNQCIESVSNQTYKNLEIILIDDGCTDKSPTICDSWAEKDPRIKVIHQTHQGVAQARNNGLDIITGDIIAFVDSDDWIETDAYQRFLDFWEDEADIICAPAYKVYDDTHKELVFQYYDGKPTTINSEDVVRKMIVDSIGSQIYIALYRKHCWDNVRFPKGMIYEDLATTHLAFANAKKVKFLPEPFYYYRMRPNSISHSPNPVYPYHIYRAMLSHYKYAKEKYPDLAVICRSKTLHYAISTCYHYYKEKPEELDDVIDEVVTFIQEEKNNEIDYSVMPLSRRIALKAFFISPSLFKFFCKL